MHDTSWCWGPLLLIVQNRTHPKQLFIAMGEPGRPCCRPWHTTQLNTSTPKRMLVGLGVPNSGSARRSPVRCFQFGSNGTGITGNLVETLGMTTASIFHCGPEILLLVVDFKFTIVIITTEREDSVCWLPPMPATWVRWHRCGNCSSYTIRSVTKGVDEAQSINALALVTWPFGATTMTGHDIKSALLWPLGLGLDRCELWLSGESSGLAVNVSVFISRPGVLVVLSRSNCKCSSVWCDLRHLTFLFRSTLCRKVTGLQAVITKVMFPYEVPALLRC